MPSRDGRTNTNPVAKDVLQYVDASTGNDANPGSQALPLKTLEAALSRAPALWRGKNRIILAAGNYDITDINGTGQRIISVGEGVGPDAEPLVIMGSGFTNVLGDRTATSGTANDVTDSTLSMTVDAHVGATLLVLSGAQAGYRKMIRGNTATQFDFNDSMPGVMGAGDRFRIERPSAVLRCLPAFQLSVVGPNPSNLIPSLILKGLKLDATMTPGAFINFDGIGVLATSVELALGGSGSNWVIEGQGMVAANAAIGQLCPDILTSFEFASGMYVHAGDGFNGLNIGDQSEFSGFLVIRDTGIIGGVNSYLGLINLDAKNSQIYLFEGGQMTHSPFTSKAGRMRACATSATRPGGITLDQGARATFLEGIDIGGGAGDGVWVGHGSYAYLKQVIGTGNAGFGVNVQKASSVDVLDANTGTTITGTGGNAKVGTLAKTWANIAAGVVTDSNASMEPA
jgi:hypothetical protein